MTIRALIADQELDTRRHLRAFLDREDDVQVIGECGSGREAVSAIRENEPDLLFLDIVMPDMHGFEVLAEVDSDKVPAVVFVAGRREDAERAFDLEATDYLLKPLRPERFRRAVERARQRLSWMGRNGGRAATLGDYLDKIPVKTRGRVRFVPLERVAWIDAAGNYVRLNTGEESFLYRETMTAFEKSLDPERFLRIHRSTIVALDRIREVELLPHGDYAVRLERGPRLTVSRSYRDRLKPLMNGRTR